MSFGFSLKQVLKGHLDYVNRLRWSSDGTILASNAEDCTIRLWDFNTGELLTKFSAHQGIMTNMSWSQDGNFLISTARLEDAKIWDVKEKKLYTTLESLQTIEAEYSPNGKFLASYNRFEISIFNAQTLELIKAFPLREKKGFFTPNAIRWSNNCESLAIGSETNVINIYHTQDWSLHKVINLGNFLHDNKDLLWMPDDNVLLVASGNDGDDQEFVIGVWDIQDIKLITELKGHNYAVRSLKLSPDKNFLASKSNDNIVRLWRCSDWHNVANLSDVPAGYNMDFHPTLPILTLPYYNKNDIALWELEF